MRRVAVERYEREGPDQIMVYGTDDRGDAVCFRVSGAMVKEMRKRIDGPDTVLVELPDDKAKPN